jgi:hypothetical protein
MNRTILSILAGSILAVNAGIAAAHGSFTFEDAYWKQPTDRTSMQQSTTTERSKYDHVDGYNN